MVSACLEAYSATSDLWWYEQAQRAFDWFIGWNDLGLESTLPKQAVAAMGCTWIGSTRTRERNQPWPSCFRLAEMRLAQNMVTSFRAPIAV